MSEQSDQKKEKKEKSRSSLFKFKSLRTVKNEAVERKAEKLKNHEEPHAEPHVAMGMTKDEYFKYKRASVVIRGKGIEGMSASAPQPEKAENKVVAQETEKKTVAVVNQTNNVTTPHSSEVQQKLTKCIDSGGYVLDLSSCKISDLPDQVFNRLSSNLIKLDLSFNTFVKWFNCTNFNNLIELNLDGNQIVNMDETIGYLNRLKVLSLNGNKLKTIPSQIMKLPLLEKLFLANNQLEILPTEVGHLDKLEEVNLSGNNLITIPPTFAFLTSLESLDLSNCKLNSLPVEIALCTKLLELNLGNNQLQELPWSIGRLTRLCLLNLCDNRIQELPISLGYCISLSKIGSGILIDRNNINDQEILHKAKIGTDHLQLLLENRLKANNMEPSWEKLKSITKPNFKTRADLEEEEKIRKRGFDIDIPTNADLQKKAVLLRGWSKSHLLDLKTKIGQKHFFFMSSTNVTEAKERALILETIYKQVQDTIPFLEPHEPAKNLKSTRPDDNELTKFTKSIDNQVVITKNTITAIETTIEKTESSKQLIGLVQCLKGIKIA